MLRALKDGFRSLAGNPGLIALVLLVNLALALVLAVPFRTELEKDLQHTGASSSMMYGFDFDWWSRFNGRDPLSGFAPDLLGNGFAWRNADLLLRGLVPGGLFAGGHGGTTNGVLLGLGLVYWLLQVFLTGGLIGVFRAPAGGWTVRGLVHGSGFYFGRLLRVSLLSLAATGVVFAAYWPFARWLDGIAREAVSERTALGLMLGRNALLVAALVLVHAVSSYAKVTLVCEERLSALLALVSSLGFCWRNAWGVVVQYLIVGALGVLLVGLFGVIDPGVAVNGWRSQLAALLLFETFVAARIALRLGLVASQVELQQARGR
jgi:hypothetical protein